MIGIEPVSPMTAQPAGSSETIIAASTPAGHGALAVVRVCGPGTLRFLSRFCRPTVLPADADEGQVAAYFAARVRRSVLSRILDPRGETLDEGLILFFAGPQSYTGEDTAELSFHGNPHLVRAFVLGVIESRLARSAEGGEFTRRAFLSGKIDLTQAEGVRRIIEARSEYEARAGRRLLSGALSTRLSRLRSGLVGLKAETEAEVDFSTEDLTFTTIPERRNRVSELVTQIDDIAERGRLANRAVQGLQLAIAGVPNAGKSSLLNQILGWERAIVSEIPGTTRDFVTEELHIEGTVLRIMDTAGLRESIEEVEREGVRRSRREIERSQIVLHVIDGSRAAYPDIGDFVDRPEVVNVLNKTDSLHPEAWGRQGAIPTPSLVRVSCKTGDGLGDLRNAIALRVRDSCPPGDPILLEDRQREHLAQIRDALMRTQELWNQQAPQEIVAIELDTCLEQIGLITGRVTTDEVLGRIFSMFCVGK